MTFDFGIKTVSLDGFQVVQRKYFSCQTEPAMTIWNTAVAFNTASHDALNNCETIEIYVNEKTKCIAIMPAPSKTVQWTKRGKTTKNITGSNVQCLQGSYLNLGNLIPIIIIAPPESSYNVIKN